jgi:DNA-binding response OmpR family regulator
MPTIALVDDDQDLVAALRLALAARGYDVAVALDGEAGLELARRAGIDLVISDVNMPKLDGFALCRAVRAEGSRVPIVLLTSRDGEIDEALGLDLGADDYVTKPFSTRVLLSRVAALLRRVDPPSERAPLVRGPFAFDGERLEVRVNDRRLEVTVTEFRLFRALALRPGVVFSRERLLELAREDDSVVAPRIIDTYVARLRRKIAEIDAALEPIETVVGAGYRFRDG